MAPTSTHGFPDGWFRALPSTELRPGGTKTAQVNGRRVVLARTGRGRVTVQGARWPAGDWNGQVMVFASGWGGGPSWQLPSLPEVGWSPPYFRTLKLSGHVQDVAENGVDLGHFAIVHHYFRVRDPEISVDGIRLRSRFAFDRRSPLGIGTVSSVFDTDMYGLGCSITDLRVAPWNLHARLLLLATQVDAAHFEFTIGVQLAYPTGLQAWSGTPARLRDGTARLAARGLMLGIVHDVLQDREIWAHRTHVEHPALARGDGPIGLFRRYARQFYPDAGPPAGPRPPPSPDHACLART